MNDLETDKTKQIYVIIFKAYKLHDVEKLNKSLRKRIEREKEKKAQLRALKDVKSEETCVNQIKKHYEEKYDEAILNFIDNKKSFLNSMKESSSNATSLKNDSRQQLRELKESTQNQIFLEHEQT